MSLPRQRKFRSPRTGHPRLCALGTTASVLLLLGIGGDVPSFAASGASSTIVVLLSDRLQEDDELSRLPLSQQEIEDLSSAVGLPLEPLSQTRDGAQVLRLSAPVSGPGVEDALGVLRLHPDVLYADRHVPLARSADLAGGSPVAQIMVKLRDPAMRARAEADKALPVARVKALSVLAAVDLTFVRAMSGGAFVLALPEATAPDEAERICKRIEGDPGVAWADPDGGAAPQRVPDDPHYPLQWHYHENAGGIGAPLAWDLTQGNSAVRVAVLDTGILFNHPDFNGRLVAGYDLISGGFIDPGDGNGRDSDASDPGDWTLANECAAGEPARASSWHGTHVAGTIGARSDDHYGVAGLNWLSPIVPVRVLGHCGGQDSDIVDGIRWAAGLPVSGVPTNPAPARVLNLSLGGKRACSSAYQSAINAALGAGAVVVVSAGNAADDAASFSPANCNGVVTVHATNRAGGDTYYSNIGSVVEISAPGGDTRNDYGDGVLSSWNTGTTMPLSTGYVSAYFQGTSMAAPHVAGVASLVLSRNPALTPAQVGALLQATARPYPRGTGADCNVSYSCGAGIVDAYAAVLATGATPSPSPRPTATPGPAPWIIAPSSVQCGTSNTLSGGGFNSGSVVLTFISTLSGVQGAGPFTPTARTSNTLTWTLPCSVGLGRGFIALRVVNTSNGYASSNTVTSLLRAHSSSGYPTITRLNGVAVSAASPSIPLAHVESSIAKGAELEIVGTGFAVGGFLAPGAKVNLFTSQGNYGPLDAKPGSTSTRLRVDIPAKTPTGPGSVQVVNPAPTWRVSNAVSIPIGATLDVTSISQSGTTITVDGQGFSTLSVINFFTSGGTNHCGQNDSDAAKCPLTIHSDTRFTVQKPATVSAGRAFIKVLNPPYISFTSTGTDPDAAFYCTSPEPTPTPTPRPTPTPGGCTGIALDQIVGDNWFGFDGVELAEGQQIKYCATLTRQASMLRFTAYDMSDRRCGSAELRVRQIGNAGWSKNSGFSAAPGVTMVGSGLIGNPALTAAGAYEVILVGGHSNEGCTRFRIGWKPT